MGPVNMTRIRDQIHQLVVAQLGGEIDSSAVSTGTDDGWFGPQSVAWRIHTDPVLLVGGIAALLAQTLHPLTMAGVADHSSYESDPWGRLQRTSSFLGYVIYGDTALAERMVARVRKVHETVSGSAPDGREYHASDPHLLEYVHITEVGNFIASVSKFGRTRPCTHDQDRYVCEMGRIAEALGVVRAPTTVAELDAAMQRYRGELEYGEQARAAVRFLKRPPTGRAFTVPYRLVFDAACSLLDPWQAEMLDLSSERQRGLTLHAGEITGSALRWALPKSTLHHAATERCSRLAR